MEVNEEFKVEVNNISEQDVERHSVNLAEIDIEDRGGFVWGLVGLLAPAIGLILHLIMRKSLPKNAKSLKSGVIISLILVVLFIIGYFGFLTTMLTASMGM